ncbi:uncharacterized protein LOC135841054 [Planococcus citri]|uniref:uncharacterized protein LOC135841054 n=1 Tax=Planococcus citri TaxID=170843 RepID=UPI0031F8BFFB
MNVLLVFSMFAASSWGLKFSFTNDTELGIFRRQAVILNCSSDEEIEWLIPDDSNAVIKHVSSNESSIVIKQTTKCDSGDYICRPKNNVKEFARIRIHVSGLRYSFENGTDIIIKLGQEFNFSCSSDGGVDWAIPFSSLASINNISVFEERVVSNKSVLSDSGDYVCRAKTNVNDFARLHLSIAEFGIN